MFHAAALERGLIPAELRRDKNSVRDFLNGSGRKDAFTELQGYVYGSRMDLASPYDGACEFIADARVAGHEVFIVSHKTRHPLAGERYDLHAAARGFLVDRSITGPDRLDPGHVFFELTQDGKRDRAVAMGVEVFIDDLPDILALPGWPESMRKVLFDPEGRLPDNWKGQVFERYQSWAGIRHALLGG